jgi:NTP pyrophosphatase (non-canonical NTP hydrolase)
MSQQGRWPKDSETTPELKHKIGESIWWLIVLADRMEVDIQVAIEEFLTKTENLLNK